MSVIADYSFPPQVVSAEQLRYLLSIITAQVPAELACICNLNPETNRLELMAEVPDLPHSDRLRGQKTRMLREYVATLAPDSGPRIFTRGELGDMPYQAALCFPFSLNNQIIGALSLFSSDPKAYADAQIAQLEMPVSIIRSVLENRALHQVVAQNLKIAQSILVTAQAIAESPSPQHIVNILHEYLFEPHISSCALLLYGPVREDSPNGPFDYLEIRGTWSRRLGSGVANGVRLYLSDYPRLLSELDEHRVLTYRNADEIRDQFDPLVRGFMRAERTRSILLFALHSARRKLGVIAIGTDKTHEFTPQELHSYRTVSEFLTLSSMAQTLQQEHDRVQQARAALLDAVTDGVVMVLPQGRGGYVLTVNERFTDLFDIPESRAEGLSMIDLLNQIQIPQDTREELRGAWLSTPVRDPATQRGEFHMIHHQGYPVDIEWYSAPVYQDAHVLGRIYIFHDVTADRTAARLRATFLSRVSHELRTPLTSIRGFAEFILEASGDQLPDLAREYTEIILNSAQHLNRVFTDMIEVTRAEAGDLKLTKQDAHLPDIIIDVVARMELQHKARQQQVIMELDDDLPPVNVDIDRIIQVITNLLNNAIKYSPPEKNIRVTTQLIRSAEDLPASAPPDVVLPAILVTMLDQGKGLTQDEVDKVFMPFFRTEHARASKIEGVGLGLPLSRSIIEMHRGKIWAEPRERASGGRFLFTLPIVMN